MIKPLIAEKAEAALNDACRILRKRYGNGVIARDHVVSLAGAIMITDVIASLVRAVDEIES